jgi:histidine triad (HIT) family protein
MAMNNSSSECVFCKIVQGNTPADIVYEDELVVAFWDARPQYPIHILIVPRSHIATFNDIDPEDRILSHMGQAIQKIAVQMGVAKNGYRVLFNVNPGGGQVIFHLHCHLLAREAPPSA